MNKLCECGCGEELIPTIYRSKVMLAKFIRGHSSRSKEFREKYNRTKNCLKSDNLKFCECGCGIQLRNHKLRFVSGHNSKNIKMTKDIIEKRKVARQKNKLLNPVIILKYEKICGCGCGNYVKGKTSKFCRGHSNQNIDVKEKKLLKYIEIYNDPIKSKLIHDKRKKTYNEKTGFDSPSQNPEVKEKKEQTNLDKTGFKNPSQNPTIKEKKENTNLEHCGFNNWSKTQDGRKLLRINSIKRREEQRANHEPDMPTVGIIERICLNELHPIFPNYIIIRQDPSFKSIIGRIPDGHIKELNLIILFNERGHYIDRRTCLELNDNSILEIKDYESVGLKVFVVSQQKWEKEKDLVINEYKSLISNLEELKTVVP